MDKVKGAIEEFKQKIQAGLDDPSSLAPAGLASCAAWYGNAVVAKLKEIMAEIEKLVQTLLKAITDTTQTLKGVGTSLTDAVTGVKGTVDGMMQVPAMLGDIAGKVAGPNDVAKIETKQMKSNLDTGGVTAPLNAITDLKGQLGPVADGLSGGVQSLTTFVQESPSKIRSCFEVPTPMCCLTSCLMSQAPEQMTAMLEQVDKLSKFNLDSVVNMVKELAEKLSNVDVNAVKDPLDKFSQMAGEKVADLDKVVAMAGGMGDMAKMGKVGGKMPKMGKMFG